MRDMVPENIFWLPVIFENEGFGLLVTIDGSPLLRVEAW